MDNGGFALDFWIQIDEFKDTTILKSRDATGTIELALKNDGNLEFIMSNRRDTMKLQTDAGLLDPGKSHHVAVLADADAQICYMLVDGNICDGGGNKIFGFSWFNDSSKNIVLTSLSVESFPGTIDKMRFYGKRMYASRFVNNYQAEKQQ